MSAALPLGRRLVVTSYGRDQRDAITRCFALEPQAPPSDLRDGDVVVQVRAAEIVWTDTVMATGQYQHQAALPYSPGLCYSGVLCYVTPSAAAQGHAVGDAVAVASSDTGPRCTDKRYQKYGGCATYAVCPVSALRRFPPSWSFAEAACFAYGYDTAFHCLVERGKLLRGETVLLHGATGGVGLPALRLAVMLGAVVIATTRSEAKSGLLKSEGAAHVIVLQQRDEGEGGGVAGNSAKKMREGSGGKFEFAKQVKALTGGKGVDVVYDGVGGDVTLESLRALSFGGRLLIVGWAATPNVAQGGGLRGSPNANRIPTNLVMMKSLNILGCPAVIAGAHDPTLVPRRVAALQTWLLEGRLPAPVVASVRDLDEYVETFQARAASGSEIGSSILAPCGVEAARAPARVEPASSKL